MMKKVYDVAIAGAGPAGCELAALLPDDLDVLLLDKGTFPREKPCGALLVPETLDYLQEGVPEEVYESPDTLKLEYVDWDNGVRTFAEEELHNVSRKRFDEWLLKKAMKDNVDFLPATSLRGLHNPGLANGEKTIKAKILVGADGPFSVVREQVAKPLRRYVAIQEFVETNGLGHTQFIYCEEVTDYYSWLIPKNGAVVVGSAFPVGEYRGFSVLKKKLEEEHGVKGRLIRKEGHMISRHATIDDVVLGKENVLLIGEAAGFISASSGEGISYALRSAKACADAINQEFDEPLPKYEELSKHLVLDVEKKIEKAEVLSSKDKRGGIFSK